MVGILLEFRLEDGSRLQIGRIGLVGLRLRPGDVERREDLRLVVAGVFPGQRLVGLGTGDLPLLLGTCREVLVVGRDGFDVVALALGLCADAASFIDRHLRLLGALGRGALAGQRIRHEDRSDSPRRDRALGIVLQHVAERLLPGGIPEGMQHRDGTLELRLHLGIAAGREGHLAQRTGLRVRVVRLRGAEQGESEEQGEL